MLDKIILTDMLDNLILGAVIIVGCYFAIQILNIVRLLLMNPLNDIDDLNDQSIDIEDGALTKGELQMTGDQRIESETIILDDKK